MASPKAIVPEIVEPDEKLPADLVALRRFAWLMDEAVAIPGTGRRVGVDAALALLPGVGEVVGALLSAWIVVGALRHRVPLRKILRMVFNILLDVAIGAVPFLGAVFDFLFEENVMNLEILLRYRNRSLPPRTAGGMVAAGILVVIVIGVLAIAVVATLLALGIWLVMRLRG